MRHGKYRTRWSALFGEQKDPEERPRRRRRDKSEEKRNADRMKSLQIGFVQEERGYRWAVRSHHDWLMYAIFEHLVDLVRFGGRYRGNALVSLVGDCRGSQCERGDGQPEDTET